MNNGYFRTKLPRFGIIFRSLRLQQAMFGCQDSWYTQFTLKLLFRSGKKEWPSISVRLPLTHLCHINYVHISRAFWTCLSRTPVFITERGQSLTIERATYRSSKEIKITAIDINFQAQWEIVKNVRSNKNPCKILGFDIHLGRFEVK